MKPAVYSAMRFLFFFVALFFFSCKGKDNKPDVSNIKVDISIERFEKEFFSIDTNNLQPDLALLQQKYPQFFPFFTNQVLQLPVVQQGGQINLSADAATALKQIIGSYKSINDSIQKKYTSLHFLEEGLTDGFKYVKHYYPNYKLPHIVTFVAPFDVPGAVLTPTHLGIGLQQYAGKAFSVYKDPQLTEMYPEYISRRFDKEYMVANSMKAIVDDIYPDQTAGRPLIEQMIEKGKQWYLLHQFLPDAADSATTGFTQKQLAWLKENEGAVWGFFTSNVDLYTVEPVIIKDYVGEGPFTRGMPEGFAPGNIGQWVGWKIVEAFKRKKTELTIQQVLATPAKTIFAEAKYKPK